MKLDFYKPINETLRKYIKGYYFISKNQDSGPIKYWTFPNNYCILTVNQQFEVEDKGDLVTISSSETNNIMTCVVSRYTKPMQIFYKELVDELTIYFHPLGINHFIEDPAKLFIRKTQIDINFLDGFNDKMRTLFSLDRTSQIIELESYLLSKLKADKDLTIFREMLADLENELTVDQLAKKYHFSRQYINRLFLRNLGKSPSEYKKIHRFRQALKMQHKSKRFSLLLNTGFYDQSHYIKDFKAFTALNPNSFFKDVDVNKENVWLIVE